jgi:hypothetical protein
MARRKNEAGTASPGDAGAATVGSGDEADSPAERVQPVQAFRLRNVRAAIWANPGENGTTRYNVTVSRSYRDQEGNWHTSESFGRDDLLLLAKVADLAHTWIWGELQGGISDSPC